MTGDYLAIVVMLVLAVAFVFLSLATTRLLAPSRSTTAKDGPYECGIVPSREPPERFPVRFYLVAMIFILFDIEIIFLFPWAVTYRELGAYGLGAVLVFVVPFFLSFLWEIAEGGLDWGPLGRKGQLDPAATLGRTTESSVRRVGVDAPAPRVARPPARSRDKAKEEVGA
ncbi:MAG: NADH-quinone oxidoreductase subunit A [Acidimicrobiales bacterium]